MPATRSAAIYARISSDQEGAGLGVASQLTDCRRLAESLDWQVGEEYVDNDLSAHSGKVRPAYRRMLADLADGIRDAVVVYHVDRLHRRPIELEQFLEVVTAAGVRHVRFVAGGDVDLANGDGLMVLRMLQAVAANESATKSRRIRRKLDEVAASGRPHGGSNRPYGYDHDRVTIRPAEAEVVRSLVLRYLAGESLRSLAKWLDDNEIRTVTGGPWRTPTLRAMLMSGRIAGLRRHRGQIAGHAAWPAIITPRAARQGSGPLRRGRPHRSAPPRRYLLTGLLRCGRCDNKLFSSRRQTSRRYLCKSGPDHGGCGRLTVVASPIEELIADAVLHRLDTAELADALAGRAAADEHAAALSEELSKDREQLDELAGLFAERAISSGEWLTARKPIEERIHHAERQLARASGSDALDGLVGNGTALRQQWAGLNLTRQHAIVAAILDHAVIAPGIQGARSLDPARVIPIWRL